MAKSKRELVKKHEVKKRRKLKFQLALLVAFLVALFVLSLWTTHRPSLLINKVELRGSKTLEAAEVEKVVLAELEGNYWWFYPKRHIWLYSRQAIIDRLSLAFPRFTDVEVGQINSQTLEVGVKERQPKFIWCRDDSKSCYYTDESGLIFSSAPQFSSHLFFELRSQLSKDPIGSRPLSEVDFRKLMEIKLITGEVLTSSVLSNYLLKEVRPRENGDYHFKAEKNAESEEFFDLIFNLNQDPSELAKNLQLAINSSDFLKDLGRTETNLEYLDLRFLPKVFYRFKL